MNEFPVHFVEQWKQLLSSQQRGRSDDFPSTSAKDIDSLITTSIPQSLHVGTGYSIFQRAIIPAILTAKRSVHFVTCYWAASPTLDALRDALLQLAASRARTEQQHVPLRVTVGFSSGGLLQKLLHTTSRDGYTYPPSRWASLGLPDDTVLRRGGVEMTVKSLFFTPLSVMHPKYVIIDGTKAFMPSCNVSWERWFEGCVELDGDILERLLNFHSRVWGASTVDDDAPSQTRFGPASRGPDPERRPFEEVDGASPIDGLVEHSATRSCPFPNHQVPTILLPSSHHRNPKFTLFPFFSQSNPPSTPLNAALLTLFAKAQRQITILTPNVTSWPVLEALLDALARGVHVQIRTSRNMMLIEQLLTAGTTTSWCLRRFIRRYKELVSKQQPDLEAQIPDVGILEILYYRPLPRRRGYEDEPVLSHFKMTLVDGEYLVLGSGNMDRASWWTSQELGILFYIPGFDGYHLWDAALENRTEVLFQSA